MPPAAVVAVPLRRPFVLQSVVLAGQVVTRAPVGTEKPARRGGRRRR